MSKKPGEWWDKSWSVVTGCTPAGEGCAHCWAAGLVKRFPAAHGRDPFPGHGDSAPFSTVVCHPSRLDIPLKRRKPTVFAVSLLGDLFHEQVPIDFAWEVFRTMGDARKHTFVVLTKRWGMASMFLGGSLVPPPAKNIILMASVWDQKSTDAACKALSQLRGVRWGLHMEPLLGPVNLGRALQLVNTQTDDPGGRCANCGRPAGDSAHCISGGGCDGEWSCCDYCEDQLERHGCPMEHTKASWIVVGGENGPGARPMHPDWAKRIRDQCEAAGVPFWFKGWGTEWMKGWSKSERDKFGTRLMGDPGEGDREWNGVPW
jgi:protein gp37